MTGKTDMVPVLNLPSHLSQPSQSENVPIFGRGTRCYFAPEKSRFWSKPREGKGKFTATPRLAPVARGVAACGPLCGLAGRRWGTDTFQPIWARVGELFGAPKAKQPAMDLSRDKNAEEMKWSPLEMGAAMQAHGA